MDAAKTVVVLGGGVGGLVAASALRKHLPRAHRVVLVDREREHLYAPSLLWLMVGLREAVSIKRPLARLQRKGIQVRLGEVEKIDPETRRVTVSGEILDADYLVVALGAELAAEAVPGLREAGHDFYTLAGAEGLRAALGSLRRGRVVVLTAAPAYKCPAAPYEAALLIDAFYRKRGLHDAVAIEVFAAEPGPMAVAGPETSAAVKQLLAAKGIAYHPEHQVTSVDAAAKQIVFANGANTGFDLLAYVPPHRAPRVVRESALAGETGWIAVDRHTLGTHFPRVFAIGDVVSIPLQLGKPLPKAGVFAHAEAEVVAKNIASLILDRDASDRFDGHGACFIENGNGQAGYGGGDFYAEPKPIVKFRAPARRWHLAKVLLEKSWLHLKV
ncbi:FAD/NAD(P)-binding oxidoreductase [Metallibacterium sp.]|uniref:NAD(P)/FAD-dependent oxidoreductase n=1 Tax=Metallibacterium sp. TaxID=2940281 RepID=UPI00261E6FED|nr:FAD/NAD(P)-binding oxidoreductase [Metallibacterium sp.]